MSSAKTIQPLPATDRTAAPQVVERDDLLYELRAATAEVRDVASHLSARADTLHQRVQDADLDQRAAILSQSDPADLLGALGDELGMPWSLAADLIGVSPTAIRKWRRGGAMTAESRMRLAHLVAFTQVIPELDPRIIDPVLWLQTRLSPATTLTAGDLYAVAQHGPILDYAAGRATADETLDRAVPAWRVTHPADQRHQVVMGPDGVPSIVPTD